MTARRLFGHSKRRTATITVTEPSPQHPPRISTRTVTLTLRNR